MTTRPRLSPTIDRFLATQFFVPFLVSLFGFVTVYMLGDFFDRLYDLIDYGGLGLIGVEYFLLKLPLMTAQVMPMASLAGALLGFALLNRSREVLACQQLGISRIEMAMPVLAVAALISAFNFVLNETIVPRSTRQAKYLYHVKLKNRHPHGVFANGRIWVRVRDGFISADSYDSSAKRLDGITLYRLDKSYRLKDVVRVRNAKWDGHRWIAEDLSGFKLDSRGAVIPTATHQFRMELTPADFGLLRLDPDEASLWELRGYIENLRRKGLDPGGYIVDLHLKYSMPLSCLIMVALGVVLSFDPLPRALSLGRSFGLAIAVGFGYWLAFGLSSSLGHSGMMPAWLAAWLPNLTFATIAAAIFLFGEES